MTTGKVKQRTGAELDALLTRFQSLAYYDQYCIASSTMDHILEVSARDWLPLSSLAGSRMSYIYT